VHDRIVITGIGVVGPHGPGTGRFWDALVAGESAIRHFQAPALQNLPARSGGEVLDFDPSRWIDRRVARRMGRFAQFALVATLMALDDAALTGLDPERTAITIHTGAGGILEGDREVLARQDDPSRVGPLYVPLVSANMAAANAAIHLGVTGPVTAGVGACAAGAIGVTEGFHLLRRGDADVVLAGSSEAALTAPLIACLANAGALSTSGGTPEGVSRPFDADRTGFVPSEGAGMFVLESLRGAIDRGARIYCEIAGAAVGCDAYHITSPEPTGAGAEAVLRRALQAAELPVGDVGLVVAHGTSTRLNDAAEAAALSRVFGEHTAALPVTAPKSVLGHGLGAAGAFGVATAALALHHGVLPPTINYDTPDPDCPLAVVTGKARRVAVDAAITNAFGFGGQNAVIVLRRVS
jgi:3-oxoacyl-[acyl-carrier-protein] synthase II